MDGSFLAVGARLSTALAALADALGIEAAYADPWGRTVEVALETRHALLAALGHPARDEAEAKRHLAALEAQRRAQVLPAVCVTRGGAPLVVPYRGPARGEWSLQLEDGSERSGRLSAARRADNGALVLGPVPHGYHRLTLRGGARGASTTVISAPAQCYLPPALALGERIWGFTVQLYGTRGAGDLGMGDFGTLAELTAASAQLGAGVVGVSPLHALFPDRPAQASPYSPSSRSALNVLYVDPRAVDEFTASPQAQALLERAGADGTLDALRRRDRVDYAQVAALKLALFEALFERFRTDHLEPGSARGERFRAYCAEAGEALESFATFEALREHHAAHGRPDWHDWPTGHRDSSDQAVATFAREHAVRVDFHRYLQWLAEEQLAAAAARAQAAAMPVGLYRDLALGVDRTGAQAWAQPALYATGFGIGAPPDEWNLGGQCWGFPPPLPGRLRTLGYTPFAAELRANMRHAGALRLDHVLGLARLYWVPDGAPASAGGYVRYPFDELLAVLALESHRAHCMVVGEDLGTVPEGLRERLAAQGVLSTRLFYFERTPGGDFAPPAAFPRLAAVGIATHDLPPLPAWLSRRDQALKRALRLYPTPELEARDHAQRSADRTRVAVLAAAAGANADSASIAQLLYARLAAAPSLLLTVQPEDLLDVTEPVNLPGTGSEYANWQLRLPADVGALCERARPLARLLADQRSPPRGGPPPPVPRATYRVQLHRGFTFHDAARQVPYLAALGVSHLYTSPVWQARAGSTHGYDVADFTALNAELGGDAGFDALLAALRRHGMGLIVDHVPNHMGVGHADNGWWLDLLKWGRASPHAQTFDIDWTPAGPPGLHGRLLLPLLGDHYGAVLESGALELRFDAGAGSFDLWYGPHRFPLSPATCRPLVRLATAHLRCAGMPLAAVEAARLDALARAAADPDPIAARTAGTALEAELARLCREQAGAADALNRAARGYSTARNRRHLHRLIEHQYYRPAFWRVAADEINYRRFFQINELAGIRQEHPPVFEATHARVLELLHSGAVQGLRIDHVDGLYDPAGYLHRLAACAGRPAGTPWLWVEKILAAHESLPPDWPVAGTTGYELVALAGALQWDAVGLAGLIRLYRRYTGETRPYEDIAHASRLEVMEQELAGELQVLATLADRLAEQDWSTRDYTRAALARALAEVVAMFPVYRTYLTAAGAGEADRRHLDWAVGAARRHNRRLGDTGIFEFVRAALGLQLPAQHRPHQPQGLAAQLALKFQQYTAPVVAKGVEDTAFYRYVPLLAACEVGSDPERGALDPAAFHRAVAARGLAHPHALNPTATHDTKRSADVRARLAVLTEDVRAWHICLTRLSRLAGPARRATGGAVSRRDEWYLYQTLVGSWPGEPHAVDWTDYRQRVQAHLIKAVREAGEHTSWTAPDAAYEAALERFVERVLEPRLSRPLLHTLGRYVAHIGRAATVNTLAHTLLTLALPGIPDLYQGSEGEHLALVDPDNRRPVDYGALVTAALQASSAPARPGMLLADVTQAKIHVVRCALALRARRAGVFADSAYTPLASTGAHAHRLLAFARGGTVIAVIPRLVLALTRDGTRWPLGAVWEDSAVELPTGTWRNLLGGGVWRGGSTPAAQLLETFPLALLEAGE